jgi:hypothetical protein
LLPLFRKEGFLHHVYGKGMQDSDLDPIRFSESVKVGSCSGRKLKNAEGSFSYRNAAALNDATNCRR